MLIRWLTELYWLSNQKKVFEIILDSVRRIGSAVVVNVFTQKVVVVKSDRGITWHDFVDLGLEAERAPSDHIMECSAKLYNFLAASWLDHKFDLVLLIIYFGLGVLVSFFERRYD